MAGAAIDQLTKALALGKGGYIKILTLVMVSRICDKKKDCIRIKMIIKYKSLVCLK